MNNNDKDKNADSIPEETTSKVMDSKQDVANSPDEKTDQDFPGYPHYPAKEDIMDKSTGSHQVDEKVQQMGTGPNSSGVNQRFAQSSENKKAGPIESVENWQPGLEGTEEERGTPQNVTNSDLEAKKTQAETDVDKAAEKGSTNP